MSKNLAIRTEGLGKRYVLGAAAQRHNSLRDLVAERARKLLTFGRGKEPPREFWALQDANIEIGHGENVGIIGLNGAGKSTLLKILSRITEPSSGRAQVDGRVGALLEVGTGFSGELTGRENVFLYGAILGMRRDEIRRKFDAILDFAGIEKFIDTPVKRYSSGMYVRLAFAVAAHLDPEILLLDEVLAVGDFAFQRKCLEFAKSLQKKDATILFVSHNMFSIKTMCERAIYLKQGRVVYDGPTDGGIQLYEEDCGLSALPWMKTRVEDMSFVITGCELSGADGQPRKMFEFGEKMSLRIAFDARKLLKGAHVIVAFIRSDGVACCNYSSRADQIAIDNVTGSGVIELTTPPIKLVAELYSVSILVRDEDENIVCGQIGSTFHVRHPLFDTHYGVFHEDASWHVTR